MKFDVIRTSDFEAGRIGAQCSAPLAECTFNAHENTWELEVQTLEELMGLVKQTGKPVKILPVDMPDEIPVLELLDVETQNHR